MQQVRRIRFLIIAIACAVLLSIAAFSVSFALWNTGNDNNATATVDGESGLFYVEYPQYITDDGVSAPPLAKGKYYIQVPRRDTPISDYYQLNYHKDTEKKLESLYLYEGDTVAVFNGTAPEDISKHNGGESTCGDEPTNNLTLSGGKYIVHSEGFYDFFYVFGERSFWVNYIGKPSGNTETPTVVVPERDQSKNSVKVKFTDATIVFEMGTAINGGNTYFYIVNGNGEGTAKPGLKMSTGADVVYTAGQNIKDCNTIELGFSYKNVEQIILYTDDSDYDSAANKHTGAGDLFYRTLFGKTLQPNYTYTISAKNSNLWWNDLSYGDSISQDRIDNLFSVTATPADGSSAGNPADSRTKVKPTCNGATNVETLKPNTEVKTVRVMDATMNKLADDRYEYHNYICVSRPNADDASDDNSIAVLEFKIEGKGETEQEKKENTAKLKTIPVSSITLTRKDTDEFGNPTIGYIDPAPRVYNYDLTNPVYLSYIGHGDLHDTFDDVDAQGKNTTNMIAHYDDGMYVILYFADKKQQYFALDISIETTAYAEFTLTASVNNTNLWDRYKEGFGEEWGYYLGGLINEVWMWNPTRTTKFEASSGTVVYDQITELNALGLRAVSISNATETTPEQFKLYDKNSDTEWNDIADRAERIEKFNNGELGDFKYCIVDYSDENGNDENGYPMWARYTKEEVDITLTINLVANSKVKLCMLDWSGQRGDLGNEDISKRIQRPTTYFLPNKIVEFPDGLFGGAATYDEDLNFIIRESGEYSFRFVGYVHDYAGKKFMSLQDGTLSDTWSTGYASIPNYNFVIDTLYISKAETVGEMIKVEFNPGEGGSFAEGVPTEQLVRFGNKVDFSEGKAPQEADITNTDPSKAFGGWYYVDSRGKVVDYDDDPVLDDLTLYVKWIGQSYEITFDGNGGKWGTDETKTVQTGNDGKIASDNLPSNPEWIGHKFDGWFTEDGDAVTVNAITVFSGNITLYAHWSDQTYNVTFDLNGLPSTIATAPEKQEDIAYNGKATYEAPAISDTHYRFLGWYTTDDCATEFDFDSGITSDTTVYAKWEADDGVYVNGRYVNSLVENPDGGIMALGALLKAGETLIFWYDNAQVKDHMFIRNELNCHNGLTPRGAANSENTLIVVTSGWYNMYHDYRGIWLTLDHAYEDLQLKDGDGLYVAGTEERLSAFTTNVETTYELTATVELTVTTTISVKYNSAIQIVTKKSDSSLGTFSGGNVTLAAGTYDFYYDFISKTLFIEGDIVGGGEEPDPNPTYALHIKGSFDGWAAPHMVDSMGDGDWTCEFTYELTAGAEFMFISTNYGETGQIAWYNNTSSGVTLCAGISGSTNFKCDTAGKYKFTMTGTGSTIKTMKVEKADGNEGGGGEEPDPGDDDIETVEAAGTISGSGVWLVGEGLQGGGWTSGVQIPDGKAVIIKITSENGWLKIRIDGTSDGSGTNSFADGSDLKVSGTNFVVTKGAGYYKFTWDSANKKVTAEFVRSA